MRGAGSLSARDTKDVNMQRGLGPWEQWVVDSPDTSIAPIGSKVPINWPIRLYSPFFDKRLLESNTGDVFINVATGGSHLRIQGPLISQGVGPHFPP
jgi:hypothetical protein